MLRIDELIDRFPG